MAALTIACLHRSEQQSSYKKRLLSVEGIFVGDNLRAGTGFVFLQCAAVEGKYWFVGGGQQSAAGIL